MIRSNPRDRLAARHLLLAGLALGVLAELAFNGSGLGIGVPIVVMATLLVAWWVRRPGRALDPFDAWLPIAAIVLAMLAAVRGDPFLSTIDLVTAAALVGASLTALSGLAVTRRSASIIGTMALWGLGATLLGAGGVIDLIRPTRQQFPRSVPSWVAPLGRGLIIGLPLALIFVVLFASADPIFRDAIADVMGFRLDLGDVPGRVSFVLAAAWFLAGIISIAATGMPGLERASLGAAARTGSFTVTNSLGLPEALVILAVIDLVVGAFVVLQIAYLFGGLDTLQAAGIPYAEYARRGFFELVGAAALASTVVVGLEATIERRTGFYLAAVATLITLTGLVLVSAALRLDLYQAAYGWTELRLYVLAAIVAMAGGLVLMIGLVVANRSRWLGHGLAGIGLVALVCLNLIAPAAFVAERNTERVIDPSLIPVDGHSGLDAAYLAVLPDDSIPVLVEALPRLPDRDARVVRSILLARRLELQDSRSSLFSWNLGRERALAALATLPAPSRP